MEEKLDMNHKPSTDTTDKGDSVSFQDVAAVASGWMLDFLFVSLCRSFKEGNLDEFNERLSIFEAICQSPSLKGDLREEKTMIIAFLSRVMHGKHLNVNFEADEDVMPLMSAARMWADLQHSVSDESVFKNITILLLVQSVAVCLEKGQRSSASAALKWFDNNLEFPKNVRVKLSTVVTQKDTFHPFLMSFSFSRLLETVQVYLDAYLEQNPSDYILKEATKMVRLSQNESLEDVVTQDSSRSEKDGKENQAAKCQRRKRKLLSSKITDLWKPDTSKQLCVSVKRLTKHEVEHNSKAHASREKSLGTSNTQKTRKPRQPWTYQLDRYLKAGVRHHGPGKWSHILMDYDFEGRTATMLKDRWRVLKRANKVS